MRTELQEAIQILAQSQPLLYPTETLFALGVDPFAEKAVTALFELKQREVGRGVPLIAGTARSVELLIGKEEPKQRRLRKQLQQRFWPGPLTLVVAPDEDSRQLPDTRLRASDGSFAVRVSSNPAAIMLAEAIGGLITSTSANPSGKSAPKDAAEASKHFPEVFALRIACGPKLVEDTDLPSTIVDVRSLPFKILRVGAVSIDSLRGFLGEALSC